MPRRTAAEAAQTRELLLTTARKLFADKGFADTNLDDVAARARVTKGALYHHFKDKRTLFVEVLQSLERELDTASRAAAGAAFRRSPREAFLAGCATYLAFARRPDFVQIVSVDGPSVLGLVALESLDTHVGLATMEAAVKNLMALGLVDVGPSRPLAVLLFGALQEAGLALMRGELSEDAALETLGRIVDGLAPRG